MTFAGSAGSPAQFPRDGLPEVALLGRSNVGKSSLLNALAGTRNLARVSGSPGRTRLVNFFRVGGEMYLVDLPGYGFAKVPEGVRRSWEKLVTSYLVGREALALCVFLVDSRHEPMPADETLREYLDHHGLPYVVAATKADKLSKGEAIRRREALARGLGRRAQDVLAVSASIPTGIDDLWKRIRAAVDGRRPGFPEQRPAHAGD